jgi:hypothetical protein
MCLGQSQFDSYIQNVFANRYKACGLKMHLYSHKSLPMAEIARHKEVRLAVKAVNAVQVLIIPGLKSFMFLL